MRERAFPQKGRYQLVPERLPALAGKHSRDRLLLQVLSTHRSLRPADPPALPGTESTGRVVFLPLGDFSTTSHVRQAPLVSTRQS